MPCLWDGDSAYLMTKSKCNSKSDTLVLSLVDCFEAACEEQKSFRCVCATMLILDKMHDVLCQEKAQPSTCPCTVSWIFKWLQALTKSYWSCSLTISRSFKRVLNTRFTKFQHHVPTMNWQNLTSICSKFENTCTFFQTRKEYVAWLSATGKFLAWQNTMISKGV